MLNFLFSFNGRANRLEYVMFGFLWVLIFTAYVVIAVITGTILINVTYALTAAAWVSSIAITVRRLHDMDLSGWVYPIAIILPYISFAIYGFIGELLGWTFDPKFLDRLNTIIYSFSTFSFFFYMMLLIWPGRDQDNRFH